MKKGAYVIIAPLLVITTLLPFACKPIPYYLQQVCKVYGKVTDANTGDPLESVEVSVGSYQYSELTNGLGDYELEMAVGTWTVSFAKEGYEPYAVQVKLQADGDRLEINAPLVSLYPPQSEGTISVQLTGAEDHDGKVFLIALVAAGEEILPDYSNLNGSDSSDIIDGNSSCIALDTSSQVITYQGGESYDVYAFIFADTSQLFSPGDYQLAQPKTITVDGDMVVTLVFPDDFVEITE